TRMQAVSGQRMYGRTLVEHMDAIGFLSPRVCFAHGIWLTPSDMELVRDRDVSIAHNPVSNLKLGSGVANVPKLLAHGANVAPGTDGMSSNDGLDMFASVSSPRSCTSSGASTTSRGSGRGRRGSSRR